MEVHYYVKIVFSSLILVARARSDECQNNSNISSAAAEMQHLFISLHNVHTI